MSAKQAYALVVGLIILILLEAVLKHFLSGLPFEAAIAAQVGLATAILTTKAWNDSKEMQYGIVPKATTTTTISENEIKTVNTDGACASGSE